MLNLIEQISMCLIQNFINPSFEQIFIDKKIIRKINKLTVQMNKKNTNIQLLKNTKGVLVNLPNDVFITTELKNNVVRVIDVMIHILRTNKQKITKLQTDINHLENNCDELNNKIDELIKQKNYIVLDTFSSKQMRDATTFGFTVS
jgi:prefoldin subunit 5